MRAWRFPARPSDSLRSALLVLACLAGAGWACARSVDPLTVLEPVDVVTGWYDDGILADGKNKLVPSVMLKFHNKSSSPVSAVQVNAIFRRVGEKEMWGEHFGWAVAKQPLGPGVETKVLVMRSALGYTGVQPRMQMLQNKEFIDAKVEIFLKTGSRVWAKLAEYPIQRQLLTR